MTASLTDMTTLGIVKTETSTKDSQLFQMPLPRTNSSSSIAMDLFGASRTINIKGKFVDGMSSKTIAQFITELDALIDGEQSTRTYVSDKSGASYTVLISSVDWEASEGEVGAVEYTISMMECESI
jgi:hypothetical protein